jgi:hypothetical protein
MPPLLAGLPFQFQGAASRKTGWIVDPPTHGPNGGVADTLDEAKAAFRAAMGGAPRRCARPRAGQRPLFAEKADRKCSL